jgi:hypothetical protein
MNALVDRGHGPGNPQNPADAAMRKGEPPRSEAVRVAVVSVGLTKETFRAGIGPEASPSPALPAATLGLPVPA